jgi:hypothetical protein
VPEADMISSVVDEFYDRLHEYGPGNRDLVDAVDRVATQSLRKESLITERPNQVDVLVALTSDEEAVLNRLRRAMNLEDWKKIRAAFEDAQPLRYSVSKRRLADVLNTPESELNTIYDSEICLIDASNNLRGLNHHFGILSNKDSGSQ